MNILILGYGYSGYYCAKKLLAAGHQVMAVSRTYPDSYQLDQLQHVSGDMRTLATDFLADAIIYCAPPPRDGVHDSLLAETLAQLTRKGLSAHFIYWGSSGVYGCHQGAWVTEESECHVAFDIQRRRLNAEAQVSEFAKAHHVPSTLMRVAGMYGPGRLPSTEHSVIKLDEAPFSNLVYIEDAARIATSLAVAKQGVGILNVSDGKPKKMGSLQRLVAEFTGVSLTEVSFNERMQTATAMGRFFLSASKRLSNQKCLTLLSDFSFSPFEATVRQCLKK